MSVYVLGGHQTDFAHNYSRAGEGLFEMLGASVRGALEESRVAPDAVEVAHVGNFTGELFAGQGHLGGFFASLHPAFAGVPASRHEAACASGSIALLVAMTDLQAGHYDVACVTGVEQMRNVPGEQAADHLGAAAWRGEEGQGARYLWPAMFDRLAREYDERFGLDYADLMALSKQAFANGAKNPKAQTRRWRFTDASFTADDEANPVVEGWMRRQDCGQITDGAAAVVLASERFAKAWAAREGVALIDVPRISGWGHRTAPMLMEAKLEQSRGERWTFPELRRTLTDAWARAGIEGVEDIDLFEVHDCFSITEYMVLDHLGLEGSVDGVEPGRPMAAIGETAIDGRFPVNASGGLIGGGHPVGATGVRMLHDCARQVRGLAGELQVQGARRAQTLNLGGSCTTTVSFVVEKG
ncbi:MAG: acetyl-CoA acetyltransferase [Deltaproteobacteria bacterium]|nr:acetyl-CoA acetyltransferase [Deltaproteobacteria bacterium]